MNAICGKNHYVTKKLYSVSSKVKAWKYGRQQQL